MTNVDTLTLSKVISLKGVYFLGYSWLFGMCESDVERVGLFENLLAFAAVWITFFGGKFLILMPNFA